MEMVCHPVNEIERQVVLEETCLNSSHRIRKNGFVADGSCGQSIALIKD